MRFPFDAQACSTRINTTNCELDRLCFLHMTPILDRLPEVVICKNDILAFLWLEVRMAQGMIPTGRILQNRFYPFTLLHLASKAENYEVMLGDPPALDPIIDISSFLLTTVAEGGRRVLLVARTRETPRQAVVAVAQVCRHRPARII